MFSMLRKLILGVPTDPATAATPMPATEPQAGPQPRFLPESQLTEAQIEAVGPTGDVWVPWRVDGSGQQWFQRLSRDSPQPALIVGLLDDSSRIDADLVADDGEPEELNINDSCERFRRDLAALEARHEAELEIQRAGIERIRQGCDEIAARHGLLDDDAAEEFGGGNHDRF